MGVTVRYQPTGWAPGSSGAVLSHNFEDGAVGSFATNGDVTVVDDPTPRASGKVARMFYDGSVDRDQEAYVRWNPSDQQFGPGSTVYLYGRFHIVDNGWYGNRKLLRWYVAGGGTTDISLWMATDLRVEGPDNNGLVFANTNAAVATDTWHEIEAQVTINSALGVDDGIIRVWLNGSLIYEKLDYSPIKDIADGDDLTSLRFGYQTQSTRAANGGLDDLRYWDDVTIATERVGA